MRVLLLTCLLIATTLAFESTLLGTDVELAHFKPRNTELVLPSQHIISSSFKLDKALYEVRTSIGKVLGDATRPTIQVTSKGFVYLSPLSFTEGEVKDLDFALNAVFGANAYLARRDDEWAMVFDVAQATAQGCGLESRVEEQTWIININSKTKIGNGASFRLTFEEFPRGSELGSLHERLGLTTM
jgi:hypothetical protein